VIDGRTVLAVVPARGGSKGVPDKNIRMLGGKPLLAWTLEAAGQSRYIDACVVSTDSPRIAEVARQWGGNVPFMRPSELAKDDTPGIEPVIHAIQEMGEYDLVVLLQPTSPFRSAEDIDRCLEAYVSSGATSVVSLVEADKPLSWMFTLGERGAIQSVLAETEIALSRQEASKVFVLNGALYVSSCATVMETRSFFHTDTHGYVMPKDRSLDIDTPLDFLWAEFLSRQMKQQTS